jgi:hypothetical protein
MMGKKKLGEIKEELRHLLEKTDKELQSWLDQKILEANRKNPKRPKVIEDLLWVQEILREAVAGKKSQPKKSRKQTKKTPAA